MIYNVEILPFWSTVLGNTADKLIKKILGNGFYVYKILIVDHKTVSITVKNTDDLKDTNYFLTGNLELDSTGEMCLVINSEARQLLSWNHPH